MYKSEAQIIAGLEEELCEDFSMRSALGFGYCDLNELHEKLLRRIHETPRIYRILYDLDYEGALSLDHELAIEAEPYVEGNEDFLYAAGEAGVGIDTLLGCPSAWSAMHKAWEIYKVPVRDIFCGCR